METVTCPPPPLSPLFLLLLRAIPSTERRRDVLLRRRMNGDGVTSPFSHTHYENVARSNARTIEARNDLSRHRSRDISHLTCKIDVAAMCLSFSFFFFPKMQIIRWLARLASREREGGGEGNKLKRTKWGWYEDDIQIRSRGKWRKYTYVARTLRASRVIGWYSDTKKLSFAFIPASNRGTICSGIKRALQTHGFHIQKRIFLQSALLPCLSLWSFLSFPPLAKIPRRNLDFPYFAVGQLPPMTTGHPTVNTRCLTSV